MLNLLEQLDENIDIPDGYYWRLLLAPDGSGELLLCETPVVLFSDEGELEIYVNALMGYEYTLTLSKVCEILRGIK